MNIIMLSLQGTFPSKDIDRLRNSWQDLTTSDIDFQYSLISVDLRMKADVIIFHDEELDTYFIDKNRYNGKRTWCSLPELSRLLKDIKGVLK